MSELLPYARQCIEEDDLQAVMDVLRGVWLTQGPTVAAFEEALCQVTGARHAVAVSSGTAALHLAVLASGLESGETALVPTVTFVATTNTVVLCGGRVSFADVNPSSGLTDASLLQKAADQLAAEGRAPRLILPVDL
jgi:dTDP-4-amino-4,6-dideoxygalactose transaminase